MHTWWLKFLLFTANKYNGESKACNAAVVVRSMVEPCGSEVNDHGNRIGLTFSFLRRQASKLSSVVGDDFS